ncbi:MAG: hypothetical protein LBT46_01895 [Planctomycetaceae bacterium]|jgi:hypothetical protein|nr:hypothetical protein [Planctomycetaceae bacterium]
MHDYNISYIRNGTHSTLGKAALQSVLAFAYFFGSGENLSIPLIPKIGYNKQRSVLRSS